MADVIGVVLHRHPSARFAVLGEGPLQAGLRRLVQQRGWTDKVLVEYRADPSDIVNRSLVHVSIEELDNASNQSLLEGMAAGCAVVASDVGADDRFDLELVYAKRLTKGAFLNVPLSQAQSGGFQNQWQNAADVSAKTAELSLNTRVFDRPNFGYTFSLTGDRTRQRIEQMGVAPFRVNAGGQGQNVFYYKAGEPLGIVLGVAHQHAQTPCRFRLLREGGERPCGDAAQQADEAPPFQRSQHGHSSVREHGITVQRSRLARSIAPRIISRSWREARRRSHDR